MRSMPIVKVSAKAAGRLRRQSPWVYRTELSGDPPGVGPGEVVSVADMQGNPLGQAFYATRSPLALRLLTREGPEKTPVDLAFFRARIEAALARRASLTGRSAYRLVHAESDLLPGLLVDRYGDAVVVQTLSEGADARKALWSELLAELEGVRLVLCRDDASGRDFEGLERTSGVLRGEGPTTRVFREGENDFEIDLLRDAKTGSFLDQADNHLLAAALARGEALDCFSYHGGYALALAASCSQVVAIEQDENAVLRARANVARNGRRNVTIQAANAFDALRELERAGRRFDCVVLDPPGFVKRKEGLKAALRAYHELNLRAFKLLRAGGLLVTCSCSGKLSRDSFEAMYSSAAGDARRQVQVLARRGAGLDHPVFLSLPETEYLKVHFLRVL